MTDDKITRLEKQLAEQMERANQTKARIRDEKSKQSKAARKIDTRRCVIAGRFTLKHIEANPHDEMSKKYIALLDEYLTAERDRALFDFLDGNLSGKFPPSEN